MINTLTGEIEVQDLLSLTVDVLRGNKPQMDALTQNEGFATVWRSAQGYSLGQATDDLRAGADKMTTLIGLLSVIWQQSRAEDDARLVQAEALRLLHASDLWHSVAEWRDVDGKAAPSWRSFVVKYLPVVYSTSVAMENVVKTYGDKLGWSPEHMAAVGMSKMRTARRLVETEIAAGGLTEETREILETETQENLTYHIAQKSGSAVGFSYSDSTGVLVAWLDDRPFEIGKLDRQTPEDATEDEWQNALGLVVRRLKASIAE